MDKTIWLKPDDFKTLRTNDPKTMLNKYLAKRVLKTWTEDFMDRDTGEVVSIERNEVLFERGKKLTKELIQEVMFAIQAGDIQDVEICDKSFIKSERWITSYMNAYVVVLHSGVKLLRVVVRAQNIETAIKVAIDFTNVYRDLSELVTPIKVNPLGCGIIDDDDDCIPEDERLPLEDKKQYYKVSGRLTYYDGEKGEWAKEDSTVIITADEVGQAKARVFRYGMDFYKETLDIRPENRFEVRKAAPFEIDALVPKEYSEMYRQKPTV